MDVLCTFLGIVTRTLAAAALNRLVGGGSSRGVRIRMWHPNAPNNFNNFVHYNEIGDAIKKGHALCVAFYGVIQIRNNGVFVLMLRSRPDSPYYPNSWCLPFQLSTENDDSLIASSGKINIWELRLFEINPARAAEIHVYTISMRRRQFSFRIMPGWRQFAGAANFGVTATQVSSVSYSVVPPMTPEPTVVGPMYTRAEWKNIDDVIHQMSAAPTDIEPNMFLILHAIRQSVRTPEIAAALQGAAGQN
jgi:hypothetical protein